MSDGTGLGYLVANPEQVVCGSPFQAHKRYKIGMLPAMITTTDATRFGASVNMVFNVTVLLCNRSAFDTSSSTSSSLNSEIRCCVDQLKPQPFADFKVVLMHM